ncbi:hypothetical protein NU219Hw_g5597t1 [Hortaea werneckii]
MSPNPFNAASTTTSLGTYPTTTIHNISIHKAGPDYQVHSILTTDRNPSTAHCTTCAHRAPHGCHHYTPAASFNFPAPASDMGRNAFELWVLADLCDPLRDHSLQAHVPWAADTKTIISDLYTYVTLARCSIMIGPHHHPQGRRLAASRRGSTPIPARARGLAPRRQRSKSLQHLLDTGQLLSDDAGWHLYKLVWHESTAGWEVRVYRVRGRELRLLHRARVILQ